MISIMDMTTGQWESDYSAPDAQCMTGVLTAPLGVYQENLPLHAALSENSAARPLCASMPVEVATQDLDGFIAHMDGYVPAR
jgi:hypothetical protein